MESVEGFQIIKKTLRKSKTPQLAPHKNLLRLRSYDESFWIVLVDDTKVPKQMLLDEQKQKSP